MRHLALFCLVLVLTAGVQAGPPAAAAERPDAQATPASRRPQEPRPPFPYQAEEVRYARGGVTLAGTLTLPQGQGAGPFPAVLLITGSGAQDRDETVAGHRPFLVLADRLTRAGYAVLRLDDRGVGGSTGDHARATYDALVGDVLSGVAFLRKRPEIDPERVGLFGHSEGGYLAALAADRAEVAFVILMAAPAVPGDEVLLQQNRLIFERAGAPAAAVDAQLRYVRRLTRLLAAGAYREARQLVRARLEAVWAALPAAQRPSAAAQAAIVRAQLENTATPVTRSFVLHDPRPALRRLSAPVLALYGGLDVQVPAAQSVPPLRRALAGNPDATVRVFAGLNHLMQPARTGTPDEYARIEMTLALPVLETVVAWLEARFPTSQGGPG